MRVFAGAGRDVVFGSGILKLLRLLLVSFGVLTFAVQPVPAVESLEWAVKGTYLYKFGPFVEWPEAAFDSPESPLQICIVGNDPFGRELVQSAAAQRVAMRPIAVRRLETAVRGAPCHIMFLAGSPSQSVAEALAAVRGMPVLTISDSAETRAHGIISFVAENNRVRFEIDDGAAAENHLVISSELLRLARAVRPRAAGAER
jgi:hypothetical protein